MRKFYLTTINLFFACIIFGQTYYPLIRPNKIWNVQHGDGSQICSLSGGDQYFFQSDTTILGLQYEIIRSYPIVNTIAGPYCPPFAVDNNIPSIKAFMREDTIAKKVYVYDQSNNADALLYDFNLIAGDTLSSFYAGLGTPLVVDSVSTTTLLNGAVRKIFYLDNSEFYVESIGGSQGLWFPIMQGIGYWEVPTCVSENNIQLWGNQCYGTLGIEETSENKFLQVFPNPSQEFLQIKCSIPSKATFTVFDLTGRIIMTKMLSESSEVIDIKELSADTYIYDFESEDLGKVTGKFTVLK